MKKIQRRLPLNDRRKVEGFIKSVKCFLKRVTPVRARRFARRARKHMLAYLQISNSRDGAPVAAASRDQIDAIVNNYYVAPSSKPYKRKRKNPCRSQVEPQNDYPTCPEYLSLTCIKKKEGESAET